jgi:hypothetical protein
VRRIGVLTAATPKRPDFISLFETCCDMPEVPN